eukprot:GHVT01016518.1.p1 GENE.GHVT01016518.1~~GHVT01016518.1.p1  ORF type:complete len:692 (+),score=131.60 GHVT01016518.1:538-2613(+)
MLVDPHARRSAVGDLSGPPKSIPGLALRRRAVGLKNFGNTCYANAALQVLLSAASFCRFFLLELGAGNGGASASPLPRRYKGQLAQRFRDLVTAVYTEPLESSSSSSSSANGDVRSIRVGRSSSSLAASGGESARDALEVHAPVLDLLRSAHREFAEYTQCDCHELLRFLLDGLSDECNRTNLTKPSAKALEDRLAEPPSRTSSRFWRNQLTHEQSIVTDQFAGQIASQIECNNCGEVRYRFDNFLDLSLDLGLENATAGSLSVDDLLRQTFQQTEHEQELDCPFCQRRSSAGVTQFLWRLPSEFLLLHLKRFCWDERRRKLRRLDTHVAVDPTVNLNMKPYCSISDHPSTRDCVYQLQGVVLQAGSLDSGHYSAVTQMGDDEWMYFSDEHYHRCNKNALPIDGRAAYVLLYKRQQLFDPGSVCSGSSIASPRSVTRVVTPPKPSSRRVGVSPSTLSPSSGSPASSPYTGGNAPNSPFANSCLASSPARRLMGPTAVASPGTRTTPPLSPSVRTSASPRSTVRTVTSVAALRARRIPATVHPTPLAQGAAPSPEKRAVAGTPKIDSSTPSVVRRTIAADAPRRRHALPSHAEPSPSMTLETNTRLLSFGARQALVKPRASPSARPRNLVDIERVSSVNARSISHYRKAACSPPRAMQSHQALPKAIAQPMAWPAPRGLQSLPSSVRDASQG